MSLKVYANDDEVVIEGDINTEFSVLEETHYLSLSNGIVLELENEDGVWRLVIVEAPEECDFEIISAENGFHPDSDSFDTLDEVAWVTFGSEYAHA